MFLTRLLARTLGESAVLTPRRASRFEGSEGTFEERVEELTQPPLGRPVLEGEQAVPEEKSSAPPAHFVGDRPPPAPPTLSEESRQPAQHTREVREIRTVEERLASVAPPSAPAPAAERIEAPLPPPATEHVRAPLRPAPATPPHASASPSGRRVEHHSIERRLETLVQEHTTERIREIAPPEQRPARSAASKPSQAPVRQRTQPHVPPRPAPAPPSRRAALAERTAPAPTAPAEPVVHVTIGRVEVRAVQAPASKPSASRVREPRMGLDDYLARRERR